MGIIMVVNKDKMRLDLCDPRRFGSDLEPGTSVSW